MKPFAYHRPAGLAEAASLLAAVPGAVPLAGGMSLLPALKLRLAGYPALVDLSRIAALRGIVATPDHVTIGAGTTHADVAASATVRQKIPALAELAGGIGDPQVRNRGTLGGVLANADPAADYPAAVLALGATIETDRRSIAADQFFTGLFATSLAANEIITRVVFPVPLAAAYAKFSSPASRFALVGVFVAQFADGVRVAVTGAGPCAFRVPAMEQALTASFLPTAIEGLSVDPATLNGDLHAEPAFRAHLIGVMAGRAVAAAFGRAG